MILRGTVDLNSPDGAVNLAPAMDVQGETLGVSTYQIKVSGAETTDIFVNVSGNRYLARIVSSAGERLREFRAGPGWRGHGYPDWRQPGSDFDNYGYLQKMLPWAGGMSYRNQPTEELTAKMINMSRNSGYKGWYGIESSGREAIKKGKELLTK